MKKFLFFVVLFFTVALSWLLVAAERVALPKVKPVITVRGDDVLYEISDYDEKKHMPNNDGWLFSWTTVEFVADLEGTLSDITVVKDDSVVFQWNEKKKGFTKGDEKMLLKLRKEFQKIKLPPIRLEARHFTQDAQVGRAEYVGRIVEYAVVGRMDEFSLENERVVLRDPRGDLSSVKCADFLFPPPKSGKFRLGRKMGKFFALVEIEIEGEGEKKLFAPVDDFQLRLEPIVVHGKVKKE